MKLSGANLEGANLADARIYLADLTGANLQQANLQRTKFGGSDLANADLRGADLRGADLSGAYLEGAKFDGEFISANPFDKQGIEEIEKDIYVEDTVKPKVVPVKKEVTIGQRRDFQETPPVLGKGSMKSEKPVKGDGGQSSSSMEEMKTAHSTGAVSEWKVKEQKSDLVKKAHPIQPVAFQEKEEMINKDTSVVDSKNEKHLVASTFEPQNQQQVGVDAPSSIQGQVKKMQSPIVAPSSDDLVKKRVPSPPQPVLLENEKSGVVSEDENTGGFWAQVKDSLGFTGDRSEEKSAVEERSASIKEDPNTSSVESTVDADKKDSTPQLTQVEQMTTSVTDETTPSQMTDSEPESGKSEDLWDTIKASLGITDKDGKEDNRVNTVFQEQPGGVPSEMNSQESLRESNAAQLAEPEGDLLTKLQEKKRCYQCDLSGLNLAGMDLEKVDLEGADLTGSSLEGADLEGANLRGTTFVRANLRRANLKESDLYKSNLEGADLTGALLEEALMDDADITGAIGLQIESVLIEKSGVQ